MNKKVITAFLKWLPVAGLLAYVYYPTFVWMVDRWFARDSYYTHGFIIPLVSLFWIFRKRAVLASYTKSVPLPKVPGSPVQQSENEPGTFGRGTGLGLAVLLFGVGLQVICSLLRIYFLSAFSFVIVIFGIVLFIFGRQTARAVWFPIAFLTLMIPLPLLVISEVTLRLKFFVSEIATYLLNGIGVPAVREGSYIYTQNAVCLVGDPCSGLRSFLAFLCLGFVFAYGQSLAMWKKAVLITAGLPLAIVSNVIRVFVMSLLGELYGMDFVSSKPVHDGGGILTFVIALLCFMLIRRELERKHA